MQTDRRTRLTVLLDTRSDPFKGEITHEDGGGTDFTGWLGLMSALAVMLPWSNALGNPKVDSRKGPEDD